MAGVWRTAAIAIAVAASATAAVGGAVASTRHEGPHVAATGKAAAAASRNMRKLAHLHLGANHLNGDVWFHDGYVYVGNYDFRTANRGCRNEPNDGVSIIDVRNASRPRLVGRARIPDGTSAEDVVAYRAQAGPYAGRRVLVSGIQYCGGPAADEAFRGLMLWDVTNAASPRELGRIDTGCCTRGVHEVSVAHRRDLGRTFAYASVPFSEAKDESSRSGRRDRAGRGDVRLIDITDPSRPREVSHWGVMTNIGHPLAPQRGCFANTFAHSLEVSDDGKQAFASYWDSGIVTLDFTNPEKPAYRSRTVHPPASDGDTHSASYDDKRKLLFVADEDFCNTTAEGSQPGYGFLRVFDFRNRLAPRLIGQFRTPNSRSSKRGNYLIHNPVSVGRLVYASWYADGVRVLDTRNPRRPREIAFYIPRSGSSPRNDLPGVIQETTQVWGVAVDPKTGVVYASDIFSGLWILKPNVRP